MGLLDRARSILRTPADRRLAAASAAWDAAPKAVAAPPSTALALPFGGNSWGQPPSMPPIDWVRGEIEPSPRQFLFRPGYSDKTFENLTGPIAFEGFTLERIRAAVAMHRLGNFWESSALMVAILSFAPVLAALQQAIAPILALKRHIHGGDKGLAKMIANELTAALVPRGGLLPSPYLPPETWGTMAIYLRLMGFVVLQHVDGEPDEETGVRPRYTRIWEPWAVQCQRTPRKRIAWTTAGPIDIVNDGKFTWVADENEGHLTGAIVALGEETLAGKLTSEQRLQWQDFFASPKLFATLPEKVPTHGEAGDAFASAVDTIYGPDGRGVLPYGAKLDAVSVSGEGTGAFQDAILDAIVRIFMVLVGSAGTIGNGMSSGAGLPYQPAKGGSWNVRHDLIARPTLCIAQGINGGHIAPYIDINYADLVAKAKRAGTWKDPVLDIPIPAPDRDERIASVIVREQARCELIEKRRATGIIVDQLDADQIADDLEVRHVMLAEREANKPPLILAPTDIAKVVTVNEARDRAAQLPPRPSTDPRGELMISELDAYATATAGGTAPGGEAKPAEGEPLEEDAPSEPATADEGSDE